MLMRKTGFTLIELLVVIAIIALLIVIILPSLKAAKDRARSVQCRSNLHQLSIGFTVYQQENDVLPYGFFNVGWGTSALPKPPEGFAGNASYDIEGWWWFDYLQSSMEFDRRQGSILWCPARQIANPRDRRNPLCSNYGVNRSVCKNGQGEFRGKPLSPAQIRMPAATMLVSDSGYSLFSWLAAANTTEPIFENNRRVDSFYIPGLKQNQNRSGLLENPDAIKGRHPRRTLNVVFADGHNEVCPAESLSLEHTITEENQLPRLWRP